MRFAAHLLVWLLLLLAANLPVRAESTVVFSQTHHLSAAWEGDHTLALLSDPSANFLTQRLKRSQTNKIWLDGSDDNDYLLATFEAAFLLDVIGWRSPYPQLCNQISPTGLLDGQQRPRAPPGMNI